MCDPAVPGKKMGAGKQRQSAACPGVFTGLHRGATTHSGRFVKLGAG